MMNPRNHPSAAPGFSLMEVLVAIAILGVGIVAVASMFPAAIYLQREAVNEAVQQQYVRSIDAMFQGRGVSTSKLLLFSSLLDDGKDPDVNPMFDVYPFAAVNTALEDADADGIADAPPSPLVPIFISDSPNGYDNTDSMLNDWALDDRSYPSTTLTLAERDVFVVPFFRRGIEASPFINDWRIYAFVVARRPNEVHIPLAPNAESAGRACANPWDPDYVPKVFREPVAGINGNVVRLANRWDGVYSASDDGDPELVRTGDVVLGDNGLIYRVSDATASAIVLNEEVRYNPENDRELRAIWYVRPSAAGERAALLDLRVLSNNVTRLDTFELPATPPTP